MNSPPQPLALVLGKLRDKLIAEFPDEREGFIDLAYDLRAFLQGFFARPDLPAPTTETLNKLCEGVDQIFAGKDLEKTPALKKRLFYYRHYVRTLLGQTYLGQRLVEWGKIDALPEPPEAPQPEPPAFVEPSPPAAAAPSEMSPPPAGPPEPELSLAPAAETALAGREAPPQRRRARAPRAPTVIVAPSISGTRVAIGALLILGIGGVIGYGVARRSSSDDSSDEAVVVEGKNLATEYCTTLAQLRPNSGEIVIPELEQYFSKIKLHPEKLRIYNEFKFDFLNEALKFLCHELDDKDIPLQEYRKLILEIDRNFDRMILRLFTLIQVEKNPDLLGAILNKLRVPQFAITGMTEDPHASVDPKTGKRKPYIMLSEAAAEAKIDQIPPVMIFKPDYTGPKEQAYRADGAKMASGEYFSFTAAHEMSHAVLQDPSSKSTLLEAKIKEGITNFLAALAVAKNGNIKAALPVGVYEQETRVAMDLFTLDPVNTIKFYIGLINGEAFKAALSSSPAGKAYADALFGIHKLWEGPDGFRQRAVERAKGVIRNQGIIDENLIGTVEQLVHQYVDGKLGDQEFFVALCKVFKVSSADGSTDGERCAANHPYAIESLFSTVGIIIKEDAPKVIEEAMKKLKLAAKKGKRKFQVDPFSSPHGPSSRSTLPRRPSLTRPHQRTSLAPRLRAGGRWMRARQ